MNRTEVTEILNRQLANVSRSEILASGLEVFPRLVGALYERSLSCSQCKSLYEKSLAYVEDIISVLHGNVDKHKEFDDFVNNAFMHLHQEHKVLPKGKILSVSVLTGMLLGLSLSIIFSYFFFEDDVMHFGALGWLVGVITGYITGKVREKNLKKKNRLF